MSEDILNTYLKLYEHGKSVLRSAGIDEYEVDARVLLLHVFDMDMNRYLMEANVVLDEGEKMRAGQYLDMIGRRASHIPLQYIIGRQNFCGLEFIVDEHVLIPRLDTEVLVERVLEDIKRVVDTQSPNDSHGDSRRTDARLGASYDGKSDADGSRCVCVNLRNMHQDLSVLDMCTGSGCIAIAVSRLAHIRDVDAVDISDEALAIARRNANLHGVDINFIRSDMWEDVGDKKYDIITCNPPYIRSTDIDTLSPEVRVYEPRLALDGGEDGLDFYRRFIQQVPKHLVEGGRCYMEIGYDEAGAVRDICMEHGLKYIEIKKDLAGLDRVVITGL